MHLDPYVALAGLIVGFVVGLTGMGGGALMTPILVLLFKIQPLAAVSSDLVAAMVMKPVGGGVHIKRGTVNWTLVRWLAIGSVPAAFVGVFILKQLGNGDRVQSNLKIVLGAALMLAVASILAKGLLQARLTRRAGADRAAGRAEAVAKPFAIKPVPTLVIGFVGGLVVGMTSVGSGSLIIVALLLLYPMLSAKQLVGTDLVQAIPLVASAALGHILFGDFKLGLTASVLIGSLPGVFLGARLVLAGARHAHPDGADVRPAGLGPEASQREQRPAGRLPPGLRGGRPAAVGRDRRRRHGPGTTGRRPASAANRGSGCKGAGRWSAWGSGWPSPTSSPPGRS